MRLMLLAVMVAASATWALPQQHPRATWRVIDSSFVDTWDGMGEHYTYRVALRGGPRPASVRGVTQPLPFVVGDSLIIGVRQSPASGNREFFRWSRTSGRITYSPVPADVWPFFTDLAVAPDGMHLAYVASDRSTADIRAVVRTWPAGQLVVSGPLHPGCECDVDMNHARWVGPDSFEIALPGPDRAYTRFSGSPRSRRLHQDALRDEPHWH